MGTEKKTPGSARAGLRDRIVQVLAERGPLTAKQVAVESGATVGNAHYHLQRLLAAGLVALTESDQSGQVEKRYRIVHDPIRPTALVFGVEDLSLTVAETGQLVNELTALLHRWDTVSQVPRARTQTVRLTIRLDRDLTS